MTLNVESSAGRGQVAVVVFFQLERVWYHDTERSEGQAELREMPFQNSADKPTDRLRG